MVNREDYLSTVDPFTRATTASLTGFDTSGTGAIPAEVLFKILYTFTLPLVVGFFASGLPTTTKASLAHPKGDSRESEKPIDTQPWVEPTMAKSTDVRLMFQ